MALVPFPSVTPGDDEDDDPATDDSGSKMSFLEHLDELRKRLIYIVYSLIVGCVIAYIFIGKLFDFIMKPMYAMLPHDAAGGGSCGTGHGAGAESIASRAALRRAWEAHGRLGLGRWPAHERTSFHG